MTMTSIDLAALKYDLEQSGRWYTPEGQEEYRAACAQADALPPDEPLDEVEERIIDAVLGDKPTDQVVVSRLEPDPVAYPNEVYPCPATEFICGDVLLEILDDRSSDIHGGVTVYNFGRDCMSLAQAEQDMHALSTILADPRVLAALGRPALPTIEIERYVVDDPIDKERHGKEVGTDYRIGDTYIYIADVPSRHNDWPELHAFGRDGVSLAEVDRVLPQIIALMNDPRVQSARAAWEATGTYPTEKQADDKMRETLQEWLRVYERGYQEGVETAVREMAARAKRMHRAT
jgi:hypothetical protein